MNVTLKSVGDVLVKLCIHNVIFTTVDRVLVLKSNAGSPDEEYIGAAE